MFGKKNSTPKSRAKENAKKYEINLEKFPMMKVKPRKNIEKIEKKYLQVREARRGKKGTSELAVSFSDRLNLKMINVSLKLANKIPVLRRMAESIHKQIRDDVVKSYLPYPSYAYASMIAMFLFTAIIFTPLLFVGILMSNLLITLISGIMVSTVYLITFRLYTRPRSKFRGIGKEMLEILGMWYGIASSNLSPQDQFEMIYKILLEYNRLNLKYGSLYPRYKLFDIFFDIHYSIKYRNYSIVVALEETIEKVDNITLKLFFTKILRAIKEQGNLTDVIKNEYEDLIGVVKQDIEKSGSIISMLVEAYMSVIVMFAGNILIMSVVMNSMDGFAKLYTSLQSQVFMIGIMVVLTSFGIGFAISFIGSKVKLRKKLTYSPVYDVLAVFSFLLYLMLLMMFPARNPLFLFLPVIIPLMITIPPALKAKKVRKTITLAEEDLSNRFHEIATQLETGMYLPDAILSTVLKREGGLLYSDTLFYFIASYMKMGFTMKSLVEKLIIRIPSDLIRTTLTIIALVEESAGNMAGVFENMAHYTDNLIEAIKSINEKLSMPKLVAIIGTVMVVGIIGYILMLLVPQSVVNKDMTNNNGRMIDPRPILQSSKLGYTLLSMLFPDAISPDEFIGVIGYISLVMYLFSLLFALSLALFISLLSDFSIPEFFFRFFLFFFLLLLISYLTGIKYLYNPEPIKKQASFKFLNTTVTASSQLP